MSLTLGIKDRSMCQHFLTLNWEFRLGLTFIGINAS